MTEQHTRAFRVTLTGAMSLIDANDIAAALNAQYGFGKAEATEAELPAPVVADAPAGDAGLVAYLNERRAEHYQRAIGKHGNYADRAIRCESYEGGAIDEIDWLLEWLKSPSGVLAPTLIEQLAAIEHERWCDWQRIVHTHGTPNADGSITLSAGTVVRWERQMATPYAELTEWEKEGDRQQVRRYLHLVTERRTEGPGVTLDGLMEMANSFSRYGTRCAEARITSLTEDRGFQAAIYAPGLLAVEFADTAIRALAKAVEAAAEAEIGAGGGG